MTAPHSERYTKMEFEHLRFQQPVEDHMNQAAQTRSTDTYNDDDERKISEGGLQLIREIQEWQQTLPRHTSRKPIRLTRKVAKMSLTEGGYLLLKVRIPFYIAKAILFCQLILVITYIMYHSAGSPSQ